MTQQKKVKINHPEYGQKEIPEDALEKFLLNEWVLMKEPEQDKKPGAKYRHSEQVE